MGQRRSGVGARGGEDIQALRTTGTRIATAFGSVACLLSVAAVPLVRGDGAFEQAGARVAIVAFLALVAAIALGWSPLIPLAVALVGGTYAVELSIDDTPLDVSVPVIALGLLLAAELAYWSLDERCPAPGDVGQGLHRAALVAIGGVAAVVVAGALLVLVDAVRTRGLALDLLGALAAVAVLVTLLLSSRYDRSSDEPVRARSNQTSNGS